MKIVESYTGGVSKKDGNVFRVRLISAGKGSSGFYTTEVLERDLAVALPKGSKVYFDHMSEAEMWEGRARSLQGLVGVFETDPVMEGDAGFADVRFYQNSPVYQNVPEFIAEALDDIGVSIEVHNGVIGLDGMVEALNYSPHNSLAIVTNPGARGRVEALAENFRTPTEDHPPTERKAMTPEEIQAVTSPILEAIQGLAEALTPADPEGAEGPDIATVSEAVATANLTEHGRKAVYAQIETGVAVEAAIKAEQDREKAILESLKTEQAGLIQESGTKDFDAEFAKSWDK